MMDTILLVMGASMLPGGRSTIIDHVPGDQAASRASAQLLHELRGSRVRVR